MRSVWLAFLFMAVSDVSAFADPLPGVRFDIMPVGCRIHGTYSTGEKTVDEYIGRTGGKHVVQTFSGSGSGLIRTTKYDRNGFMVRKEWADGKWESFAPYSCFSVPGTCRYTYRNADGQASVFVGKVTRRGGSLISSGGFEGQPPFPPTELIPGPFNSGAGFDDGSTSFRVTKYENCGDMLQAS